MKCLVVYTSRSGNTEKLARAIAAALGPECVLAAAADAPPPENFDFIALGFGVYGGWPDGDLRSYMKRCRRKNVGLFMTLGAWPDSEHAFLCMGRAEGLLENCTTRVKFICQGGYTPEHLARMKSRPADSPHAWDAGREARVAEAMKHPDETDLRIAADRFRAAAEKLRNAPPRPAKPPKRAQVLAVFGSTVPGAEASYRAIEDAMRERHPELPLFRACTSYAVRSKCAAAAPSLSGVLMRLVREGYAAANLVVGFLSAGEEYHKVRSEAAAFGPQLELCVTRPRPRRRPFGFSVHGGRVGTCRARPGAASGLRRGGALLRSGAAGTPGETGPPGPVHARRGRPCAERYGGRRAGVVEKPPRSGRI